MNTNMPIPSTLKSLLGICALTGLFIVTPASAADIEAGKTKAAVCAACHGNNGAGVDGAGVPFAGFLAFLALQFGAGVGLCGGGGPAGRLGGRCPKGAENRDHSGRA